jgi:hypothetical protein
MKFSYFSNASTICMSDGSSSRSMVVTFPSGLIRLAWMAIILPSTDWIYFIKNFLPGACYARNLGMSVVGHQHAFLLVDDIVRS